MSGRSALSGTGGFTLVELLVTLTIMGLVASAITSVVISTMRVEQNESTLQQVVDDGRLSLQRIRTELRGARRIHEDSGPSNLRFWVDSDQDQIPTPEEEICFVVEPLGSTGGQWQISRWTHAETPADCVAGAPVPAGSGRRMVARTLIEDAPFSYTPVPAGPLAPPTREVDIRLLLEVVGERNLGQTVVEGAVRLRNVP